MVSLAQWLDSQQLSIRSRQSLSGGDICQTQLLDCSDGARLCVKQRPGAPDDFFAVEAAGLAALAACDCIRVPEVYATGSDFIALEYIAPGKRDHRYWQRLGEQLAQLHRQPAQNFGFERDNYCGLTPQPNTPDSDGHRFFIRQRLQYQGDLALSRNLLSEAEREQLDSLCETLRHRIPEQPPALIHGDLWAGNIHCDAQGQPVLLDPATHRGWAEAELAMTQLFGGFDSAFYHTYLDNNPLNQGWRERVPLYNLYHLLNHLNLFGSSYHPQVSRLLATHRQ